MANTKNLGSVFSRFTPTGEAFKKIFEESDNVTLSGDREKKMYEVHFSLPEIAPKDVLYALEEQLRECYSLTYIRLLPKYPQNLFTPEYMGEVYKEAKRVGAVTNGFFDNCKTEISDGVINISVPFSHGGVELLDMGRAGEIVSGIIRSEFSLNYETVIEQSDDYQKYHDEFIARQAQYIKQCGDSAVEYRKRREKEEEERKAKEAAANDAAEAAPILERVDSIFDGSDSVETLADCVYKSGRMTFDTSSAELIWGEEFEADDPTVLRAVRRPMKNCVVLGQIFEASAAEMRGSDKMAITIGITDKDSSVFLKTVMDAEGSETFVKSMKSGMCIAAAGSVRQDKFGEFNVNLKGIKKIKQVIRSDNAPVKRVELHLHTNLSAMDAIPKPEDVVRRAAAWGQKAVAVTDHDECGETHVSAAFDGLADAVDCDEFLGQTVVLFSVSIVSSITIFCHNSSD